MYSIETRSLTKSFGGVTAVDNVSLCVEDGDIFGFLGTNGAGKSTTVMILTTLLKPTSGHAKICGLDVVSNTKDVRQKIGYVQQEVTVDDYLTGRQNLVLQARLNHVPPSEINSRIDDALDLIGLAERQNEAVLTYSGGMRKRLDIAGGLLHRPRVLFLDEPTVGLDIQTRQKIWEHIRKIHDELGMTVFLTTHYMEEADNLCDRIGIIHRGKILADGSPSSMKADLGDESILVAVKGGDHDAFTTELHSSGLVSSINEEKGDDDNSRVLVLFTSGGSSETVPEIFRISSRLGLQITSISLNRPTLDDVFMSHTGHEILDDDQGSEKRFDTKGNAVGRKRRI